MNATDIHHAHPSLEAVGRALPWLIIAILVAMVSLTVGAALWLAAPRTPRSSPGSSSRRSSASGRTEFEQHVLALQEIVAGAAARQ
ncbi:hypothetical protein [Gordonia alkaliphila]|uniref:Uncharacterized protein n=1 Tax=Gordonia alkaliphila TaxID=1053547 RepID=A0ABP8Z7Y4_9ACTN